MVGLGHELLHLEGEIAMIAAEQFANGEYDGRANDARERELPAELEYEGERADRLDQIPQEAVEVLRDEIAHGGGVGREARQHVARLDLVEEADVLLDERLEDVAAQAHVETRHGYGEHAGAEATKGAGGEVSRDEIDGVVFEVGEVLLDEDGVEHLAGVVGHKGLAYGTGEQEERAERNVGHVGARVLEEAEERRALLLGLLERLDEDVLVAGAAVLAHVAAVHVRLLVVAFLGLQQAHHVPGDEEHKGGEYVPRVHGHRSLVHKGALIGVQQHLDHRVRVHGEAHERAHVLLVHALDKRVHEAVSHAEDGQHDKHERVAHKRHQPHVHQRLVHAEAGKCRQAHERVAHQVEVDQYVLGEEHGHQDEAHALAVAAHVARFACRSSRGRLQAVRDTAAHCC